MRKFVPIAEKAGAARGDVEGQRCHLGKRIRPMIETMKQAISRRKRHRRALERGNKRQRGVATSLRQCRPDHRCGTEACSVCMRDYRLWWLGEGAKIMVQRPYWTRASVVTQGLLVKHKKLRTFDLKRQIKRIQKQLQRNLKERIVLGGLDVCLYLEKNDIVGWQFHLYLIVDGRNDAELQKQIKEAFPAEPSALVPYDFEEIKGVDYLKVLTYAYKAIFKRRSGFTTSTGNHRTKNQPLKDDDLRRLLPFLAKYKVGTRLVLSGVRRNGKSIAFVPKPKISAKAAMKAAA
jgi:hypothetical protein